MAREITNEGIARPPQPVSPIAYPVVFLSPSISPPTLEPVQVADRRSGSGSSGVGLPILPPRQVQSVRTEQVVSVPYGFTGMNFSDRVSLSFESRSFAVLPDGSEQIGKIKQRR